MLGDKGNEHESHMLADAIVNVCNAAKGTHYGYEGRGKDVEIPMVRAFAEALRAGEHRDNGDRVRRDPVHDDSPSEYGASYLAAAALRQAREALHGFRAALWDSLYGHGITKKYAQSVDAEIAAALRAIEEVSGA